MMEKKKAKIIFKPAQHIARLMTGFYLLEKSGQLICEYQEDVDNIYGLPSNVVEVRIGDDRIAFDMGDRMALHSDDGLKYVENVVAYFARSYEPQLLNMLPEYIREKVKPFGFDYYMTYYGNPADAIPDSFKGKLEKCVREISGYSKCMHVNSFEKGPDYKTKDLKIMFMSRLWNPQEIELNEQTPAQWRPYKEYMIEERNKINRERVQIVRQLREIYGASFLGGIQDSTFARNYAPDVLVPLALTRKGRYLHEMQRADICVGSMGLHKSIGWKTGEYVAASRAIVAERFYYQLPGGFEAGKNYLPFDTAEECLENVELLYKAPEAVYNMKVENHKYYCNWLRPEAQILRALEQVY